MSQQMEMEASPEPDAIEDTDRRTEGLTRDDIRHNMRCCIALDAVWTTGWQDFQVALGPLLVYLGASNTEIGSVLGLTVLTLFGYFLSPWISRRFVLKKRYFLVVNVPYILPLGLIGLILLVAPRFAWSKHSLLLFVVGMVMTHKVFEGFVGLPAQEYIAACIPMTHRGRYSGLSNSIGSLISIGSTLIGGLILKQLAPPGSFGWLMVLTWVICQGCFVFAALAREKPHRLENAPAPWSRAMLEAAWNDKVWLRLLLASSLFTALFGFATTYVPYYAWKTLQMPRESSAWFQITGLVMRTISFGFGGYLVDRLGAKRVLMVTPLATLLALVPPLLLRNEVSIYLSTGIGALTSGVTAIAATVAMFSLPKAENRAGHYTLQLMIQNVANGVGPLLAGVLCDRFDYLPTFALAAFGSLLFIPVYGWAVRPMQEVRSES